ncbi:sugar ABC transporter permease [Kribbella sp. NPDC005582]|uniref:carbohydrate ABC transporter permease n=1 Tax=Kribbella sp. NPDC005582 TaxID=3156893 RepID=UPI0033AD1721
MRPKSAPYALALPFLVLFALFYLLPIGYAIWDSLHKRVRSGGFGSSRTVFAGWENYHKVLSDPAFAHGVLRVLAFGIVQVPVMLGLALVLALVIDSGKAKLVRFFRMAYFLPYAVPGVIAAILWGFLYSPAISPIADLLGRTPIGPIDFLGDHLVLWSIGNIVTWSWTGYNMLIIFSALQAIPREIFEAAEVDGASQWQVALRIKLPMVVPALVLTGVFSVIGTLQLFTEPSVLSKLTGSVDSAYTPNLMAYTAAFTANNTNLSAAISVVLALVTFILSFALLRLTWRRALEA